MTGGLTELALFHRCGFHPCDQRDAAMVSPIFHRTPEPGVPAELACVRVEFAWPVAE
jgi:hypothetical protein